MNTIDYLASARTRLFTKLKQQEFLPPEFNPLPISLSLAAALLQKAVRRGETAWATGAAASLLHAAPDRLWRRLAAIAFEEVGLADMETVFFVTAASTSKRFRDQVGGDWLVASFLVRQLSNAPKCRAPDDLLMMSERHPAYCRTRLDLAYTGLNELLDIAVSSNDFAVKAIACWNFCDNSRRFDPYVLFETFAAHGLQPDVVAFARASFCKTREMPPVNLCLLHSRSPAASNISDDEFPSEALAHGIPGWTYDMFSPEGRKVLSRFLITDCLTARWIAENVPRHARLDFMGKLVFQVEGGLCRKRLRWELGDRFRGMVDRECFAPYCRDATDLLELARTDIPALNAVRAE